MCSQKIVSDVTIRDVAQKANVGVGTVSRVINGSPSVSKKTREKVLAAISELDYRPNINAQRLRLGKTLTVAAIVPFFTRPALVERLRGIEHALAKSEYELVLYNVETLERRDDCFLNVPRRENIDGLLIMSLSPDDQTATQLRQSQVPTVLLDAKHPTLNRITINDVAGCSQACQHLINLGHSKIALISDFVDDSFGFTSSKDRLIGYKTTLANANIPFRETFHKQGDHTQLEARKLTHELLALPDPPSAIIATSDTQAIGILGAANDLGINIPQDLSVIGYDDIEIAEYLNLTTVHQPLFTLGVAAVEMLLEIIDNPISAIRHNQLETRLVVRGTTAVFHDEK